MKSKMRRSVAMGMVSMGMLLGGAKATAETPYIVPLMPAAPTLDGRVDPGEWASAHGFEGMDGLGTGSLVWKQGHGRVRAYVGATRDAIHVAVVSKMPDEGELKADIQRDQNVVGDDSIEVYINPSPNQDNNIDYQFLFNSLGFGYFAAHMIGVVDEDEAWRGNWQQAHGFHDGWWHAELTIPLKSMRAVAPGRTATDGIWGVNLCRTWQNVWTWSSLSGGYMNTTRWFRFTEEPAPAVQVHCEGHFAYPPNAHVLTVHNPTARPIDLHATMLLERNVNPELTAEETFKLAAGETKALRIAVDDPTTTLFHLTTTVTSADGQTTYYNRKTRWDRAKEEPRWVVGEPPPPPPATVQFAYFPSTHILRLAVDIAGMPEAAKVARVFARVERERSREEVTTVDFPLADFVRGRQELRFEVPRLRGQYAIRFMIEGEEIPEEAREIVRYFERKVFPWERTPAGRSTKVYPPFTPLKLDGNRLDSVLRTHDLNAAGLLDQVTCESAQTGVIQPILAAPMRYVVAADETVLPVEIEDMRVVSSAGHEVVTEGAFTAGPLRATWTNTWDYDGCVKVELTLQPTGGEAVDRLTLEIPFTADQATMIHANSDRIRAPVARHLSEEQGELWNGSQVACDNYIPNFTPYVYIGNAVRGLCWFAENDRNWGWDPETPNMRLVREGDQVVLRIHLINQPTVVAEARTITFGMLAAPVKPRYNPDAAANPNGWRYRYRRDGYGLLGTDINWFAPGNAWAGPFYPVGKDLYLWEILSRANRGVGEVDARALIEHGRPYFEGGGGMTDFGNWEAHARANLQPRRRQIFYYNRAAGWATPDEFATFGHEWGRGDFGHGGYLAPPESFINFTLYWFARSFEIGNNQGVYWDEWFIAPNTNTEMTDAYRRADGTLVPAAGMWALREWQKRTFIMMNERGMRPITMVHMTSFSPLPMLSFATIQFDWEWKYSAGEVQRRFTRDYLQLLSTGDLAGAWPTTLWDHGPHAGDPWTQRTFAAVKILHDLDGPGGNSALYVPFIQMTDKPDLKVYRYWDERAQPAATGNPDLPLIVYSLPGKQALIGVVSYLGEDTDVTLAIDLAALGLDDGARAVDAETGEAIALEAGKARFLLKRYDLRMVRVTARE